MFENNPYREVSFKRLSLYDFTKYLFIVLNLNKFKVLNKLFLLFTILGDMCTRCTHVVTV
jgi:hypothetical protein